MRVHVSRVCVRACALAGMRVQPFLVMDVLPQLIIPALYSTVELKMERIVDLGPFKHKARVLLHSSSVFIRIWK